MNIYRRKIDVVDIENIERNLYDETIDKCIFMSDECEEYKIRARKMPYDEILNYIQLYNSASLFIGHHLIRTRREFYIFLANRYDADFDMVRLRVSDIRRYETYRIKSEIKALSLQMKQKND